ncbi:hypothetical protein P171DRAFT_84509 [Karstenula rhodostoma CBS 690.94]|uniref:DUF7730 domain-containing protein n=1 Tax=Karstenula rhodostoma CBS 690.94 TaxID=1392251 RepID=A0A9P4PCX5_9PLEO|nr:hypothetical protein P171DRAFT_84509 [Karstenula rhodostoma CBS 690.94]
MGSYSAEIHAFDNRFATPPCLPPAVEQLWKPIQWKAKQFLLKAPKRYARWRGRQDKCWRARLPRKIEQPAISLNSKTLDQLQSRFFQLPLELREEIYDYIFDGGIVRLDVQEKVDGKVVREKEPYRLRNMEPQQCLAILQACKKTYVEAAHLLYSTNTFKFLDLTTFVCFERLVPNHYWHRIQSICIAWDYDEIHYLFQYHQNPCPANEQTWNEVCQAISKMKGLGFLRVDLELYAEVVLQPLQEITAPAIFEFFVWNKRKAFAGRCGCGCGRAESFHGSGPY